MARPITAKTKTIREAIKKGFSNADIADALNCSKANVAYVRHAMKKQGMLKNTGRYKARKAEKVKAATARKPKHQDVSLPRNVPAPTMPIALESSGKYTWFERVRIFFRGW